MSESQKKILEMLAQNKISVDDATRLLKAVGAEENAGRDNTGHEPEMGGVKKLGKYLRVTVTPGEEDANSHMFRNGKPERVNVKVPMSLIRAGIKLSALIPPDAIDKANSALKDKGINFDVRNIKQDDLEGLLEALGDAQIDIEGSRGEKIKVFVE
ncbi:MAG TPA: hypothetical protein VMB24_05710 [Dehalococcoidales bacterium]|nr:hypothetical protein [Dehalococcoidales bacterium]